MSQNDGRKLINSCSFDDEILAPKYHFTIDSHIQHDPEAHTGLWKRAMGPNLLRL